MDLNIDNTKRLGADVDLNETRVDGFVEFTEPRNQSNGTLIDILVGVGARQAREGTEETTEVTEHIQHRPICPMNHLNEGEHLS